MVKKQYAPRIFFVAFNIVIFLKLVSIGPAKLVLFSFSLL